MLTVVILLQQVDSPILNCNFHVFEMFPTLARVSLHRILPRKSQINLLIPFAINEDQILVISNIISVEEKNEVRWIMKVARA